MEDTIVFIDDGFLSKLSKYFGKGKYLKFDKIKFSKNISKKVNLICKHIFYYTAPPFISEPPTEKESKMKKNYDAFIKKISENKEITIREGRCQRLKINGKFIYKQKAVDTLAIIDILSVPIKFPTIKKIILIASDSDFVPVVKNIEELNIKTILYTYYEEKRDTNFSRCNELIKSVYRYVKITKEDFNNALLDKLTS